MNADLLAAMPTTPDALAAWPPLLDGTFDGPDVYMALRARLGPEKAVRVWQAVDRLVPTPQGPRINEPALALVIDRRDGTR